MRIDSAYFWIFHDSPHALSVLDRKTSTLTHYSFQDTEGPNSALTVIMSLTEGPERHTVLATHGAGLLKLDREHRRFIRYRNKPCDPTSLPERNVENLFADREGSIWAAWAGWG